MYYKRFLVDIGTTLRQVIRVTTNSQVINHATNGKHVVQTMMMPTHAAKHMLPRLTGLTM